MSANKLTKCIEAFFEDKDRYWKKKNPGKLSFE